MNIQVNPIARDRNTRVNFVNTPIILATLVILTLLVIAGIAATGNNSPGASPSRAIRAETARYTALAEFYARQRPEQAEIARWNGWAHLHQNFVKAEQAEIARLNGLAESYGVETNAGLQAKAAEIARWNGLAAEALALREARKKADQAYAARLTGIAQFLDADR